MLLVAKIRKWKRGLGPAVIAVIAALFLLLVLVLAMVCTTPDLDDIASRMVLEQ